MKTIYPSCAPTVYNITKKESVKKALYQTANNQPEKVLVASWLNRPMTMQCPLFSTTLTTSYPTHGPPSSDRDVISHTGWGAKPNLSDPFCLGPLVELYLVCH